MRETRPHTSKKAVYWHVRSSDGKTTGRTLKIALTAIFVAIIGYLTVCAIAEDYRNGTGMFLSTADYREMVREGKEK